MKIHDGPFYFFPIPTFTILTLTYGTQIKRSVRNNKVTRTLKFRRRFLCIPCLINVFIISLKPYSNLF